MAILKKIVPAALDLLSPQLAGRIQHAQQWLRVGAPMNKQTARLEIAREIMELCGITRVIETGTFLGNTTEWFAQFNVPVITIEVLPRHFGYSSRRLKKFPNVELRLANSVDALKQLVGEPLDRSEPTFFYLDAHWYDHLPLKEEIETIFDHFAKPVIMIDDFQVPDDPGYGYDDYGPGKQLTLAYVATARAPMLSLYFPRTRSQWETGARRGCLVAAADPMLAAALDTAPLLRCWKIAPAANSMAPTSNVNPTP